MLGALLAVVIAGGFFPTTVPVVPATPSLSASLSAGAFSFTGLASAAPAQTATALEAGPIPLTVLEPGAGEETLLASLAGASSETGLIESSELAIRQGVEETPVETRREPETIALYYRHEVQEGETLSGIAGRYGVDREHIIWNNIDVIDDENLLTVGQILQVPSVGGILHAVRLGETVSDIAALYDANVQDIIDFPANNLGDPNMLVENTTILVPGGRLLPVAAPTLRPDVAAPSAPAPDPAPQVAAAPEVVPADPSTTGFIWPVVDLITSYFGPAHPLGIDINAPYVPVAASAPGQVVFAGGDPCCSYGLYVEIRHEGGYESRYAHFSSLNVGLGEWVEQGQIIGVSGETGRSTGPHLHFELRRNGLIVDPLAFLP